MKKKGGLLAAMQTKAGSVPRPAERRRQPEPRGAVSKSPGRDGKRNVTGYFPPVVNKQLKQIGIDHDKTIQRLLAEALNDLFVKYGKPEVAPIDEGGNE
jgi:hypothetical protein